MKPGLVAALLGLGGSPVFCSEPIKLPSAGVGPAVHQPHITAELIAASSWSAGRPFEAVVHLHMDPGWHTYWVNPGDAGLATTITWTLPAGFESAGPLLWPVPEREQMGPLTTYGFSNDVYLPTVFKTSSSQVHVPAEIVLSAHVEWLVCQEACVPGQADLTVTIPTTPSAGDLATGLFLNAVHERLPSRESTFAFSVSGQYEANQLDLIVRPALSNAPLPLREVSFYPEQPNVLATSSNVIQFDATRSIPGEWHGHLERVQNGEKPALLSGVIVFQGSKPSSAFRIAKIFVTSDSATSSGQ